MRLSTKSLSISAILLLNVTNKDAFTFDTTLKVIQKQARYQHLYTTNKNVSNAPTTEMPIVVEKLDELTKESFFCLRTTGSNPTNTCAVECKRIDGKCLGGHDDDPTGNRRAFVFAREPSNHITHEGPILVHVREIPFSYGKLGGQIWYAAVAFAQYIAMNASFFEGKQILELGAGLGLPGLVASKCGGYVTLSEFGYQGEVDGEIIEVPGEKRLIPSALIDNLRYNALLNAGGTSSVTKNDIRVRHLDWYDYVIKNQSSDIEVNEIEGYDILIGSDLINWEDDVGPLISTLKYFLLARKGSIAIISLSRKNRRGLPMFLEKVKQEFRMVDIKEQSVVHFEEHPLVLITLSM